MCRLIGYGGGIILFLVLGVKKLKGYQYFFATAILNVIAIGLIFLFRILAKNLNGFWRIWSKRLQKQISKAMACLSHVTELPEYEITTVTTDAHGHKSVQTSTTCNTLIWGCVECALCVLLTGIAPLIVAFIIFCYVQAIYQECQFRKETKKQNQMTDNMSNLSVRMSLGASMITDDIEANSKPFSYYRQNYKNPEYPIMIVPHIKHTYMQAIYMPMQRQMTPLQQVQKYQRASKSQFKTEDKSENTDNQIAKKEKGDSMMLIKRKNIQLDIIKNDEL